MSGDATEAIRSRIVDFADHPAAFALLRGSAAFLDGFGGNETRVFHAERFENAPAREFIERHGRCLFNNSAEQNVADVAVDELAARRLRRIKGEEVLPSFLLAGLIVLERIVGDEARRVRQELRDRD